MIIGNYIELLEQNKNLILTGAPGTGKTYLAKQIASQFCLGKDYEEVLKSEELKKEFESQCGFVQFHPSLDYTDFVEGLRPINIDGNSNIGFERRDGVFKEFCKRALKNIEDSEKDNELLTFEHIVDKYLREFIYYIIDELDTNDEEKYITFPLVSISGKYIAGISYLKFDNDILFLKFSNKSGHNFKRSIDKIVDFYKIFISKPVEEWNKESLGVALNYKGLISYVFGFLKVFYDKYNQKIEKESKNINIEKIEKKNFVFIIDEINRGEISKIFGELFFSIDAGYRGEAGKVLTQYSNLIENEKEKYFYIPENVYIIGTMNDIDRSVESMDFAMRRRFAWREVDPTDTQSMLDTLFEKVIEDNNQRMELIEEVKRRMNNLNGEIENTRELSSHYKIGASYFLKLENYYKNDNLKEACDKLWEYHLKGLLFEYLRGFSNQDELLDNLKNAYEKVENDIIVEDSNTENNNEE